MARMWIVVNDITSSGGLVVSGSAFTDIDGKPVARINDMATCPLHKGVFPIVDGDITMIVDGQPVALHGSSLACGCKVLAVQQNHVFVDPGGGQQSAKTDATNPGDLSELLDTEDMFDEQFRIVSSEDDAPLAHRSYRITASDGRIWEGTTDADGLTERVYTDKAVELAVEVLLSDDGETIE